MWPRDHTGHCPSAQWETWTPANAMAILATYQATTEPGLVANFLGFLQSLSSASSEVP